MMALLLEPLQFTFMSHALLISLVVYCLLGAIAGVLAGLLGVGGGIVIVPMLVFAFGWQNFPPDVLMLMALGTSMGSIMFTSISSSLAHSRNKGVQWDAVRNITPGILIGTFGPRLHMITYTTQSANLMLRALGLSMYLACLGLDAGTHFFETVMRPEGALWLGIGFALTFVPVVLVGLFALRVLKVDFGSVSGLLCGSMANPMALNYVNDTIEGDNPSVSYATVYPVCMFLRVIIIQVMLMLVL